MRLNYTVQQVDLNFERLGPVDLQEALRVLESVDWPAKAEEERQRIEVTREFCPFNVNFLWRGHYFSVMWRAEGYWVQCSVNWGWRRFLQWFYPGSKFFVEFQGLEFATVREMLAVYYGGQRSAIVAALRQLEKSRR